MESKLETLPTLSAAHLRGEIPTTKILAVLPVVTEETERAWAAMALHRTSRSLAAAVRAYREAVSRDDADAGDPAAPQGGADLLARAEPLISGREGAHGTADSDNGPDRTTENDSDSRGATEDEPEPTERLEFGAPAPVAHLFDHAVDVARRVAGWQAPLGTCFSYMLGEYLAGLTTQCLGDPVTRPGDPVPHSTDLAARLGDPAPHPTDTATRLGDPASHPTDAATRLGDDPVPSQDVVGRRVAARRQPYREGEPDRLMEVLAPLVASLAPSAPPLKQPTTESPKTPTPDFTAALERCGDPRTLDAHLRALMKLRQRRHGEISRLLASLPRCSAGQKARDPVFARLTGLSQRSFWDLVGIRERMLDLPRVTEAYWSGEIGWSKLRLLLRVCRPDTQDAWIDRAVRVTVRRLELEVQWSSRRREEYPASWCSDGGPPQLSFLPPRATLSDVRPGAGLWKARDVMASPIDATSAHDSSPAPSDSPRPVGDEQASAGPAHMISPSDGTRPTHTRSLAQECSPVHTISPMHAIHPAHTISPMHTIHPAHTISPPVHHTEPVGYDPHGPGSTALANRSMATHRPAATPCRIRIFVPPETAELWRRALDDIRRRARRPVAPWEALLLVLEAFLETWDGPPRPLRSREHKILDRDGYQCAAPGCSARRGLEVHHIIFRSRGGNDEPANLITLCTVHHRRILHEGWMTCTGRSPAGVVFGLGRRRPVHYKGDVLVTNGHGVSAS